MFRVWAIGNAKAQRSPSGFVHAQDIRTELHKILQRKIRERKRNG